MPAVLATKIDLAGIRPQVPLGTDEEAAGHAVGTRGLFEGRREGPRYRGPCKSIAHRGVGAAWLLIAFAASARIGDWSHGYSGKAAGGPELMPARLSERPRAWPPRRPHVVNCRRWFSAGWKPPKALARGASPSHTLIDRGEPSLPASAAALPGCHRHALPRPISRGPGANRSSLSPAQRADSDGRGDRRRNTDAPVRSC